MSESEIFQDQSSVLLTAERSNIIFIRSALYNVLCFLAFCGFGLFALGGIALRAKQPVAGVTSGSVAMSLVVIGSILFLAFFIFNPRSPGSVMNLCFRWIARRRVGTRSSLFLDPGDPITWFVEVLATTDGASFNINAPVDVGFLAIDQQNRLLIFEGDNERYRLAAKSIIDYKQDYCSRYDTAGLKLAGDISVEKRFFIVAITTQDGSMVQQKAFRILWCQGGLTQAGRYDANHLLFKELKEVMASK